MAISSLTSAHPAFANHMQSRTSTAAAMLEKMSGVGGTTGEGEASPAKDDKLKETFTQFVGQTFFGQMMKSMRSTQQKPAYFHGGRGEEVFQQQLDQVLTEEMSKSSADKLAEPMFNLFQLSRR